MLGECTRTEARPIDILWFIGTANESRGTGTKDVVCCVQTVWKGAGDFFSTSKKLKNKFVTVVLVEWVVRYLTKLV